MLIFILEFDDDTIGWDILCCGFEGLLFFKVLFFLFILFVDKDFVLILRLKLLLYLFICRCFGLFCFSIIFL